MRISDWSSDVCSSDLADFRDVLLEATRRTVARYSAAPGSTVFQERRPAPEPRAIPAFLKYRLPMAGNGEPLSHGLLRPIVKFIQQMKRLHSCQRTGTGIVFHPHPERSSAVRDRGCQADITGLRSEEHTSELQSQM